MTAQNKNHRISTKLADLGLPPGRQEYHLETMIQAFLIAKRSEALSIRTLEFYRDKLRKFVDFCDTQAITMIDQIDAGALRLFLTWLEDRGHTEGGRHAYYRSVKAFLKWWDIEYDPIDWVNPIKKVKAPKLPQELLDPADIDVIRAMLDTCRSDSFTDIRDKAVILTLMDTGCRARELLGLTLDHMDPTGRVTIRQGKGKKDRIVFLGKKTQRAVRSYLRGRRDGEDSLWVTNSGTPLTYAGLRQIMRRRARYARVRAPSLHSFRRYFAITCLRNGMDVYTLRRLMGHSSLKVLDRYLKQDDDDLRDGHVGAGPVDGADL